MSGKLDLSNSYLRILGSHPSTPKKFASSLD